MEVRFGGPGHVDYDHGGPRRSRTTNLIIGIAIVVFALMAMGGGGFDRHLPEMFVVLGLGAACVALIALFANVRRHNNHGGGWGGGWGGYFNNPFGYGGGTVHHHHHASGSNGGRVVYPNVNQPAAYVPPVNSSGYQPSTVNPSGGVPAHGFIHQQQPMYQAPVSGGGVNRPSAPPPQLYPNVGGNSGLGFGGGFGGGSTNVFRGSSNPLGQQTMYQAPK